MPAGLKRYQQNRDLHFITFSCYQRRPLLAQEAGRRIFEETLERVRRWYDFYVTGYVVMPEHVHMLMSEPERGTLRAAIQMLKQITSQKLRTDGTPFWYPRYYDFNVYTRTKRIEKLRYIHRNPVNRGLVASPEDWPWSSFRHYVTGVEGRVEIESEWTGRKREKAGAYLKLKVREVSCGPEETICSPTLSPTAGEKDGAPSLVENGETPERTRV